jgi:uncharacterized protein with PIN domain
MLGKLTRWLRMLGHNVKYSSKLDDAQLIMMAKKERRILLTRDLELYQQAIAKGVDAFYLEGENEAERLARLAKRFKVKLDIDMATSRCPKCNTRVKPIAKERVAVRVENSTFSCYNEFWECPKCGQIYWQGAHWTRIRKTLETAKENLERFGTTGSQQP